MRINFAEVTACREYRITIDWVDVTEELKQCEAEIDEEEWLDGSTFQMFNHLGAGGLYDK